MTDVYIGFEEFYELKGENEDNTFEITITKDMNPNIVAEKILEIVNWIFFVDTYNNIFSQV